MSFIEYAQMNPFNRMAGFANSPDAELARLRMLQQMEIAKMEIASTEASKNVRDYDKPVPAHKDCQGCGAPIIRARHDCEYCGRQT